MAGGVGEESGGPVLTVDGEGVVVACNRTAPQWFGLPEAQIVGCPLAERFAERERRMLERLAAMEWAGVAERRYLLEDGRRVTLNATRIHRTSRLRYQVTVRDVTNRVAIEQAEDQRRRALALADLAGEVARDLNDPMSIVQGRLELLIELGEEDPASLRRHLEVALVHARRISATLQNLRLVGRTTLSHLERVFLLDALAAARELVGPRLEKLDLEVDLDPPELAVGGEEALYARILCNLIDQVLEACGPRGRLEIRGRQESGEVHLRVLGGPALPGVPLLPPHEHEAEGEGLALTIVRTLVAAMGGVLSSRVGSGRALFDLRLPEAPVVRARARPVEATLLAVGREAFAATLEGLLGREGFALHRVSSGEDALEALGHTAFQGVVTELLLPGMSGLSLVQALDRRHPELAGRVVLLSEAALVRAPRSVRVLRAPLRRRELLLALGRKVRRR